MILTEYFAAYSILMPMGDRFKAEIKNAGRNTKTDVMDVLGRQKKPDD